MNEKFDYIGEAIELITNCTDEDSMLTAVSNGDRTHVVANTNEQFDMGLIAALSRRVLENSSCCEHHFREATGNLAEVLRQSIESSLNEVKSTKH